MIDGWVLAVILLFVLLLGGLYIIGMRILTQQEIIVKAIPFGAPKIMERPRPPTEEQQRTRPVGSTAQHARG